MLNEALWISCLKHYILNPNQLRANGVLVQDNPYHTESMTITSNDSQVRHVSLTSSSPWNPREISDCDKQEIERYNINTLKKTTQEKTNPNVLYNPKTLCQHFISNVRVHTQI